MQQEQVSRGTKEVCMTLRILQIMNSPGSTKICVLIALQRSKFKAMRGKSKAWLTTESVVTKRTNCFFFNDAINS